MRTQEERDEQTVVIGSALGGFVMIVAVAVASGLVLQAFTGLDGDDLLWVGVLVGALGVATLLARRGERRVDPAWHGPPRVVGWTITFGWLGMLAAVMFAGQSHSTYTVLEQGIRDGDVTSVEATEGLDDGGRGFAAVQLTWRDGWFTYTTLVVERSPGSSHTAPAGTSTVFDGSTVRQALAELDPSVEVVDDPSYRYGDGVLDHDVPGWALLFGFVMWLLTVTYLIASPQPWRATKWAWFWLFGIAPPLAVLAFLVLGGPTGLYPARKENARRLTGGWAFLIAVLLGSTFFGAQR